MKNTSSFKLPLLVSVAVIALFSWYYWPILQLGSLQEWDEFFTLGRSVGFVETGDLLAVRFNAQVDFTKPPLQYWLGAALISLGAAPELAVRFWPFFFALALLGATGLLAYACQPKKPYVIPTAIVLLCGSYQLWRHATGAYLDTGAAFFLVLAVASALLALNNPVWWVSTGVAVGLGFLQKTPAALIVLMVLSTFVILFRNPLGIDVRRTVANRYFKIGAFLACGLLLFWPLVQLFRFGTPYVYVAFLEEIARRFAPSISPESETGPGQFVWLEWIFDDGSLMWACAGLALMTIPLFAAFRRNVALLSAALVVAFFALALSVAGGSTYPRYVIQMLPFLSVIFATTAVSAFRPDWVAPLLATVLVAASGEPFQSPDRFFRDRSHYETMARRLAERLQNGQMPLYCIWGMDQVPVSALVYYADLDRPIVSLENPRAFGFLKEGGAISAPYLGMCEQSVFDQLAGSLGPVDAIDKVDGYVFWSKK